jgi:hypothetical protein
MLGLALASALSLCALDGLARVEQVRFGGAGGAAASIACPPEHVVAGARIFARDDLVAGVALLCARDDGSAAPLHETATLGDASARAVVVRCASDHAAVGIWGATGALVDQLSLSCARRTRPRAPVVHLRGVGGRTGIGFHARCAGRMRGLDGAAGAYLDSVVLVCEGEDG